MTYLIPRQLKKGQLLFDKPFKVYLMDVAFIGGWLMLAWMASAFVHSKLYVPYAIFAALCALYLTRTARENPGKRKWEAILLFLAKKVNRPVYYSIDAPKEGRKVTYEGENSKNAKAD